MLNLPHSAMLEQRGTVNGSATDRLNYAATSIMTTNYKEEATMKAYALIDMDIHDPEGYSKYPPRIWPIIEKHDGKITHRISDFEVVEGDWSPNRILIVEFPDKAAAKAFMDDPDYQPLKELRLSTTRSKMVLGNSEI